MKNPTHTGGMLAGVSAVLTAVASSACCWLPLTLIAFGVSAGSIGTWFERYRLPFLAITFLLLATAFYIVYFRAPKACAEDTGCKCNKPSGRWIKGMLWVSTIIAIAFAAFPRYVNAFITPNRPDAPAKQVAADLVSKTIPIQGMSCKACAVSLQNDLQSLPGVVGVEVSYETKSATVTFDPDQLEPVPAIRESITKAGYRVRSE